MIGKTVDQGKLRRYALIIIIAFSDRYRGTYRLVSTDTAVRIAAFVLTSRYFQGTYRDTYSSRYRLVRTSSAVRTPVRNAVRTD